MRFLLSVIFALWLHWPLNVYAQLDTLRNTRYTVIYSKYYRGPVEVFWKLYKADLLPSAKRYNGGFKSDKRVGKPRAISKDYTVSGFQRGHVCPAADWGASITLQKETFIMSNVVPMPPALNMGAWKHGEIITRSLATQFDSVLVVVNVSFSPGAVLRIGRNGVAVPESLYKVVRTLDTDSLLFEQKETNFQYY